MHKETENKLKKYKEYNIYNKMSYKSDFNKAYSKLNKINTRLKKEEENESLFIQTLLPIMLNKIQKRKIKNPKKQFFLNKTYVILFIVLVIIFFTFNHLFIIIFLIGLFVLQYI